MQVEAALSLDEVVGEVGPKQEARKVVGAETVGACEGRPLGVVEGAMVGTQADKVLEASYTDTEGEGAGQTLEEDTPSEVHGLDSLARPSSHSQPETEDLLEEEDRRDWGRFGPW